MNRLVSTMRTALHQPDASELHHLIEGLAKQGHTESELCEQLEAVLLEERADGATDEVENRIIDVLERLTGWCHESCRVQFDPVTPKLEVLNHLPHHTNPIR